MKKQFLYGMASVFLAAGILCGCGAAKQESSGRQAGGQTSGTTAAKGEEESSSGQQAWDADTVTIYVPTKAGNQADLYIRFITPVLEEKLGKSFVVVNQTDGNGVVAYETVRNADKDGSTLLYFLNSMVVQTHTGVYDKTLPDNFTPLAVDTSTGSMWLTVKADSKYQSVQDIIDDVKANPGKVTYGMTSGQALHMLGGMMESDMGAAEQYLETKEIRVLGCVTGNGERDPIYPDIPSVTEEGLGSTMFGFDTLLLGPAGMDDGLVQEINKAFQEAMEDPEVVGQFAAMKNTMKGLDVEESARYIKDFDAKMQENAKNLGFQ